MTSTEITQDDATTDEPATPTELARECLGVIRKGWAHVLDPIKVTSSGGSSQRTARPATEAEVDEQLPPDARFDTPRTLAFWVRAAITEWPAILQTLQPVNPEKRDSPLHLVTTETIDCADVPAMVDLLDREAGRLATWVEGDHDFGSTFLGDLEKFARAVSRIAWPPKGDRITIGDCPECGRRVRVKAPHWRRVPQPTTDPETYAPWSEWQPARERPIACRCGIEDTIEGWHGRMVPFELREPLTAKDLVVVIQERMGLRYQPLTVRTWQRRGLIQVADYSKKGEARYDVTQVLAALVDREKRRDLAS